MIGFLKGKLLASEPNRILLDVNGVGYNVRVPFSTYCEIEKIGPDEEIELFVRTHVREDAFDLYGFFTSEEKRVFEHLVSVNGIGPRLAQVVMSGMSWEDILAALAGSDAVRLTRIPGVGKKTAERMVLELRDKAADMRASLDHGPVPAISSGHDDLVSALVNLGYRKRDAESTASEVYSGAPEEPFHELLRLSLKRLSRA